MKNLASLGAAVAVVASLAFPGCTTTEALNTGQELPRSDVVKRDGRGRVQVMETRTRNGTCMAEITYGGVPRIYVVVLLSTKIRNLGFLQINDGTEDNLSDEVLMRLFGLAIKHCLPLIVTGYDEA